MYEEMKNLYNGIEELCCSCLHRVALYLISLCNLLLNMIIL